MPPITPYPDIDDLLRDLLDRMEQVLGDRLLGLYLYGSLVAGDFEHAYSDVDMLAVVASALTDRELDGLHAMHDAFAADHPVWLERVEVAYVPASALRTFRTQESTIAAISPGEPFHTKQAGSEWLMNWWIVRRQGVTLFGPPPETFIDPISREEFLQNVRQHARLWSEWLDGFRHLGAQGYVIVTGCRALYALEHGRQPTKREAVDWARSRYPEWAALIGDAFTWIRGAEGLDPVEMYPETERFVRFMQDEVGIDPAGR